MFSPISRARSTAWAVVTVTFFSLSMFQVAPSMVQWETSSPKSSAPEKSHRVKSHRSTLAFDSLHRDRLPP